MTTSRAAQMNQVWKDLHCAWPEVSSVRDPHAGDEILGAAHDYANYRRFAPPPHLEPEDYLEAVDRFEAGVRDILDGRAPWSSLDALAASVGVEGPIRHDRRQTTPAALVLTTADLAEVVEDWVPDVGLVAPDRVLGPFADGPLPRWLIAAAVALLAFSPLLHPRVRPIDRVIKSKKPRARLEVRSSLKAIGGVPTSLWARTPEGWTSLLPLAPAFLPTGPVAGSSDAPFVVGRVVRGPEGFYFAAALPLPAAPPAALLVRRMEIEVHRARLWERRATWEDVLRDHGEVVARSACEWCDLQGIDIRVVLSLKTPRPP